MTEGLPLPRRYVAILAISFGTALIVIDGAIATVALPTIARDLDVDSSASVLVVTVYQLIFVMTLLPFAHFGDQLGHRRLYQLGQIVFLLATIACVFARSLPLLLAARAAQAIGGAAALSVSQALLRWIYPSGQLGRGLAINSVIVSVSSALAPTLGGLILTYASWPWIFAATVPLGLFSLMIGRALPEPQPRDESFDWLGALLCAATFGLIISGLETGVHGGSRAMAVAVVIAGLAIGYAFVRRELHEPRPMLPIDLFSSPVVTLSVVGAFTSFLALSGVMLSLPFRLQHLYGFTPGQIGTIIAALPLAIMVAAPTSGILSDRIQPSIIGTIGMSIAVVGLLLLAFLPADPSANEIRWRLAVCGAGFGMFFSPNARLIIGSTPHDRAAAAGGLISTNRLVGQTSGATLAAALLAAGLGAGRTPALVAAGLTAIAALCSAARLRPSLRKTGTDEVRDLSS